MITAEKLATLTSFTAGALTRAIRVAGYKMDTFETAKFVGITNGGQFCYSCAFVDEDEEMDVCKVFLTYDSADGTVTADY
jgi:hypothetical protein